MADYEYGVEPVFYGENCIGFIEETRNGYVAHLRTPHANHVVGIVDWNFAKVASGLRCYYRDHVKTQAV